MRILAATVMTAMLTFALPPSARADGDVAKGEKVFTKCKACHEIANEKNKVGPSLHGVIGRKAGTVPGFKYSPAMANSGVTWDAATIAEYVAKPKEFITGNKMAFVGLKKEDEIQDLIAFITASCCS
ncbi:MAG TPA: cytochrome c family protein [Geminicoccaceae bacterium]|nr:cytochrome c family protein [Geminicoccus sp.]HMU50640.1 cytochrome c family protein [Geminicoccaceae bacterium]